MSIRVEYDLSIIELFCSKCGSCVFDYNIFDSKNGF